MASNEHPDMHGNPMDAPFLCDCCGSQFREEDAYGVPQNDELLFCSAGCTEQWLEKSAPTFDLARQE